MIHEPLPTTTARECVHTQRWTIISLPSFSSILDTRSVMVASESAIIIYTAIQHDPAITVLLWTTMLPLPKEEARSAYVAVVVYLENRL